MFELENGFLKILVDGRGGELQSIVGKKTGYEYLWNGDSRHWKYHAPILFPIVGKVKDGKYMVEKNYYNLPQHGFARLEQFKCIEQNESQLTFRLKYSDETLKVYPYRFILYISYKLIDNNVVTEYSVENIDDKEVYFSIGGHPAYMCPIEKGRSFEDYYFEFEHNEYLDRLMLDSNGYFVHKTEPFLNNEKIIPLSYDLFNNDAVVLKNTKSQAISLKSDKHKEYIKFYYKGFPYLGLWTKEDAPFVCIEPWYGHADYADFVEEFSKKEGSVVLELGEIFHSSYKTEIYE